MGRDAAVRWFLMEPGGEERMSDRADVVRKTLRRFAAAEIRLLVEEAERVEDHELVEDRHDVLDRLKLPAVRHVLH